LKNPKFLEKFPILRNFSIFGKFQPLKKFLIFAVILPAVERKCPVMKQF